MNSPPSLSLRLLRIIWPFLAIVLVLVLLATESIKIVSASRAYVGGESLCDRAIQTGFTPTRRSGSAPATRL